MEVVWCRQFCHEDQLVAVVVPQPHLLWVVRANVGMELCRGAAFDFVTGCRLRDDIPVEGCGFGSNVVDHEVVTAFETSLVLYMVGESDRAFVEAPWPIQPKSRPHWQYADGACHNMRPPHPGGPHTQRTQTNALARTLEVGCHIAPKVQTY